MGTYCWTFHCSPSNSHVQATQGVRSVNFRTVGFGGALFHWSCCVPRVVCDAGGCGGAGMFTNGVQEPDWGMMGFGGMSCPLDFRVVQYVTSRVPCHSVTRKQHPCPSNTRRWFRQLCAPGVRRCVFQWVQPCATCAVCYLGFERHDLPVLCQGRAMCDTRRRYPTPPPPVHCPTPLLCCTGPSLPHPPPPSHPQRAWHRDLLGAHNAGRQNEGAHHAPEDVPPSRGAARGHKPMLAAHPPGLAHVQHHQDQDPSDKGQARGQYGVSCRGASRSSGRGQAGGGGEGGRDSPSG